MILLIIQNLFFSRHYYADVDKTRIEIKRLIKDGEWDTKEFTEMREKLLKELQIKHNPIDDEVILEKLEKLTSNDDNLEKEIRGISINLQKLLKSELYHDQFKTIAQPRRS
uniref:Uncharacterized protein n=1 Tax=Rhizophagus irregularis (strain DAOM 181602 / DAOM 197198 / MUCL 43194) TaxID=747089 RepID=U9SNR0_RHIID